MFWCVTRTEVFLNGGEYRSEIRRIIMVRKLLCLICFVMVFAFAGSAQALVVVNGDFEGGWFSQGWGPTNDVPNGWNSWDAPPNLQTAYAIPGNPGGATPAGGCALEVKAGNPTGGYSFLWDAANVAIPAGFVNTWLCMSVDIIDLTPGGAKGPGGAEGNFAGVAMGVERKIMHVTNQWQTFKYYWKATGTSVQLKIVNSTDQILPKGDYPAIYGFDNIVVTPEPATMVLLGLGSLALLKRRKS
jgi:hypothetical protein